MGMGACAPNQLPRFCLTTRSATDGTQPPENTMHLYCTENPIYGFHGEMQRLGQDAPEAFDLAAREISKVANVDGFTAAAWLDSREGRHFGDDVANYLAAGSALPIAIHQAVGRWLDWTISDNYSRETGIPEGMSYLVGVVNDHAIRMGA